MARLSGQPGYKGGASGTLSPGGGTMPKNAQVYMITAHATGGGAYLTINGGDQIPIPAGVGFSLDFTMGPLYTAPTLVFSGTDS